MDFLVGVGAMIEAFMVDLAGSPLVLFAVLLLCVGDAILPPVPSETVLVAVAAVGAETATVPPWILIVVAAAGAWVGDASVFWLGRAVGVTRWRWMRRRRVAAAIGFAQDALARRGVLLIMTARFVPVGRVAVNLTAGATGYRWRRFAWISGVAALVWATYTVTIGAFFGRLLGNQPLLATALGVCTAILLGLAADKTVTRLLNRLSRLDRVRPVEQPERSGGSQPS